MENERRENLRTVIALLALVMSSTTLVVQVKESAEKRAEILNYEIGGERINPKEIDEYLKVYNHSERDIYLESITLRADMSDGLSRKAEIYRPRKPDPLRPGEFRELRFRLRNSTPADKAAEDRDEYKTFTGRSVVEVITTKGTRLTFESHYHPYFIDRINRALAKSGAQDGSVLKLQ